MCLYIRDRFPAPFSNMPWNLQTLRAMRAAMARSADAAPARPHGGLAPGDHRQLQAILRRHASVLQLTVDLARAAGRDEAHAALGARLAILRARVAAGDASRSLAVALAEFGLEFHAFITLDLRYRSA